MELEFTFEEYNSENNNKKEPDHELTKEELKKNKEQLKAEVKRIHDMLGSTTIKKLVKFLNENSNHTFYSIKSEFFSKFVYDYISNNSARQFLEQYQHIDLGGCIDESFNIYSKQDLHDYANKIIEENKNNLDKLNISMILF